MNRQRTIEELESFAQCVKEYLEVLSNNKERYSHYLTNINLYLTGGYTVDQLWNSYSNGFVIHPARLTGHLYNQTHLQVSF